MTVTLRLLESTDAAAASALLPDLGYEATAEQVARRLAALREWPDQEAFVADDDGRIVGLCHVQGVRMLNSEGYAEIQALVVSAACQGQGLGRKLVAHAFYEHLGFAKAKASYAFELRKG